MEQKLLTTLSDALNNIFYSESYGQNLLQIKRLFLTRDFTQIFGNKELLHVYISYYTPGRMLAYKSIFDQINFDSAVCLGAGNGAELFALIGNSEGNERKIHISDMSDYNLSSLISNMKENFNIPEKLELSFGSVLDSTYMNNLNIGKYSLITTNFLLNEILNNSKKDFVRLIKFIVSNLVQGQKWLVVDAASSFSECNVAGKRPVMIYDLLDNLNDLLILAGENSKWYRPSKELKYPIKIQSMRYFYRIYQKK